MRTPWKPAGRVRESVQMDTTKKAGKYLQTEGLRYINHHLTGQQ